MPRPAGNGVGRGRAAEVIGRCAGFEAAGFVATMTRGRGLMHGEVLPAEVEEEFEAAIGEAGERFRSPNRTRSPIHFGNGLVDSQHARLRVMQP